MSGPEIANVIDATIVTVAVALLTLERDGRIVSQWLPEDAPIKTLRTRVYELKDNPE